MKKRITKEDLEVRPTFSGSKQGQCYDDDDDTKTIPLVTETGEKTCVVSCMQTIDKKTCDSDCFLTFDATCNAECKSKIEGYSCQCDGDTKSEQQGTGSLCISVVLCKETERNCDPNKTEGKICVGPTLWAGCQETVQYCASVACFTPSNEYCPESEQVVCAATGDCKETEGLCIATMDDGSCD